MGNSWPRSYLTSSRREEIAENVAGTRYGLTVERPVGIELQTRVDAADTVVLAGRGTFPIGVERANAGLAGKCPGSHGQVKYERRSDSGK